MPCYAVDVVIMLLHYLTVFPPTGVRKNSHLSVMSNSERTWALTKTGDALKAQEAHEYHHGAETAATWMKISTFVGSE